jgi:hypothetical protein
MAVVVGFVIYPVVISGDDVVNADWPAFETGARLIAHDPGHLYDLDAQARVQSEVTGGKTLVTLGIKGILPFLAPAWVALVAVPFDALGPQLGGRFWMLFGLAAMALGLYLACRPRAPGAALPALASVPTAIVLINAQIDGVVVLGLGAAISLWSRPWLAGLCLGLTLFKPNLILPVAAALLLARQWRVVAAWTAAGVALTAFPMLFNPNWVFRWLEVAGGTVQRGSREIVLADLGPYMAPSQYQSYVVGALTLMALAVVMVVAARCRTDFRRCAAVLVAGCVFAAPHALPGDLVLVALALAIWDAAQWYDWLALSVGATVAAFAPPIVPTLVGIVLVGWLMLRVSGLIARPQPEQRPVSAR